MTKNDFEMTISRYCYQKKKKTKIKLKKNEHFEFFFNGSRLNMLNQNLLR